MPLFTPIREGGALPRTPTTTRLAETQTVDFKWNYSPENRAEMAKDVAAFANALGGVIIIGASEDDAPLSYPGVAQEYAERIANGFADAHARHLSPKPPVLERKIFPSPDNAGRVVLAVNVQPFADQVVGARVDQNVWRFPIRVGVDTNYLEPAMLPLYTSAVRRNAILLETIDHVNDDVKLSLRNPRNQSAVGPSYYGAQIVRVELERNIVVVTLEGASHAHHRIPLDDIDAVWEAGEHSRKEWVIRILGFFSNDGGWRYESNPSNTVIRT